LEPGEDVAGASCEDVPAGTGGATAGAAAADVVLAVATAPVLVASRRLDLWGRGRAPFRFLPTPDDSIKVGAIISPFDLRPSFDSCVSDSGIEIEAAPKCSRGSLLLTERPADTARMVLRKVFALAGGGTSPFRRSSVHDNGGKGGLPIARREDMGSEFGQPLSLSVDMWLDGEVRATVDRSWVICISRLASRTFCPSTCSVTSRQTSTSTGLGA